MTARRPLTFTLALLATAALAEGRHLTAQELDTHGKLRDAYLAVELAPAAEKPQYAAALEALLKRTGWNEQRFKKVDSVVVDTFAYLDLKKRDRSEAAMFWENTERIDDATLNEIARRRPTLDGAKARVKQAQMEARELKNLGPQLSAKALVGTWKLDRAASLAHLGTILSLSPEDLQRLLDSQPDTTYVFRPGGPLEVLTSSAGRLENLKGTWKLEGRALTLTHHGRPEQYQVGAKGPTQLVLGTMGVPAGVYVKQ